MLKTREGCNRSKKMELGFLIGERHKGKNSGGRAQSTFSAEGIPKVTREGG